MATGDHIETRTHLAGFREEIEKVSARTPDEFFTWFDTAANRDASFVRGEWDFALHIARYLAPHIKKPEDKSVLEIGYGGGRILAAAARGFGRAVGVDIHPNQAIVEEELKTRGIDNVQLFTSDGTTLPCPDGSIDVVYSFIVLQHVERIAIWEAYLRETYRVLKPGGLAMLYFGRWSPWSLNRSWPFVSVGELLVERFFLSRGYREMPARVNDTNLLVSLSYARKIARSLGFRILTTTVSRKRVPDGLHEFGSQHGLLLIK